MMMMMMMMMMMSNKRRVRLSSSFTSSSRPEKKITFGGNVFFPILDDLKSLRWSWWRLFLFPSQRCLVSDLQKVGVIGSLTALSKEEDQSTPNARSFTHHRGLETEEEERKKNNARARFGSNHREGG